jgi:hypothetical protein
MNINDQGQFVLDVFHLLTLFQLKQCGLADSFLQLTVNIFVCRPLQNLNFSGSTCARASVNLRSCQGFFLDLWTNVIITQKN